MGHLVRLTEVRGWWNCVICLLLLASELDAREEREPISLHTACDRPSSFTCEKYCCRPIYPKTPTHVFNTLLQH